MLFSKLLSVNSPKRILPHLKGITFSIGFLFLTHELFIRLIYNEDEKKKSFIKENANSAIQEISNVIRQAFTDSNQQQPYLAYSSVQAMEILFVNKEEFSKAMIDYSKIYFICNQITDAETRNFWKLYYKNKNGIQKKCINLYIDNKPYRGEITDKLKAYITYQLLRISNLTQPDLMVAVPLLTSSPIICIDGGIFSLPLAVIYAIAAHEAMHIKYYHKHVKYIAACLAFYASYQITTQLLNKLPSYIAKPTALVSAGLWMYLFYYRYVANQLSKITEIHADLNAAKELSVANELSIYFNNYISSNGGLSFFGSTHPRDIDRVRYLRPFINRDSLFFKSKCYLELKQRESQMSEPRGEIKMEISDIKLSPGPGSLS